MKYVQKEAFENSLRIGPKIPNNDDLQAKKGEELYYVEEDQSEGLNNQMQYGKFSENNLEKVKSNNKIDSQSSIKQSNSITHSSIQNISQVKQNLIEKEISKRIDINDIYIDDSLQYRLTPTHKKNKQNSKSDQSISAQSSSSYIDDINNQVSQVNQTKFQEKNSDYSIQTDKLGETNDKNGVLSISKVQNVAASVKRSTCLDRGFLQVAEEGVRIIKKQRRGNIVITDQKQILWKKNWIQIMYYIGKMKRFMKQTVIFFHPQLLTKWQLQAIHDKACDFSDIISQHQNSDYIKQYSYQKYERLMSFKSYKKIKKFFMKYFSLVFDSCQRVNFLFSKFQVELFEFLPIFNSMQKFYIFWEFIIFLCTIINVIYIPLEISFEIERNKYFQIHFQYICVLVFCTDVFIRSNTQYYEQGSKTEVHKLILRNYIKKRLIFDIISILSLNQQYFQSRYTILLFFFRIFYSTRIIDIFREQFLLRIHLSGIISLILLFAQALYFCHIFSCSFYALGSYQVQYNQGWLVHYNLENVGKLEKYLNSYYFSVVTMTTIGYGDISAQSNYEKGFMIVFTLVSCGIFGYTINSIGNILYDFKLKRDEFLFQLAQLNKYFKFYNTDLSLQRRARKYIEYTHNYNLQESSISVSSLDSLSPYLQVEIRNDTYKKAISKNKIMKQFFSEQFIEVLATRMKEIIVSPDQIIIEEGTLKEPSIYFVNNGIIHIFSSRNSETATEIQKLRNGDVFGIEDFFMENHKTPFSVKSQGVTSLLSLNLTDFQDLLQKYPDQVEMFSFLKDSLQFNKDFSKLQLSCYSCAQYNHSVNKCPYLFYGTNPQKIIRNYCNKIEKYISHFKREEKRAYFNSRLNNEDIRNKADQFFLDYQDDLSYDSSNDSEFEEDEEIKDNVTKQDDYKSKVTFNNQKTLHSHSHSLSEDRFQDDKSPLIQLQECNSIVNQGPNNSFTSFKDQDSSILQQNHLIESQANFNIIPKSTTNLQTSEDGILKAINSDKNQKYYQYSDYNNIQQATQNNGERKNKRSTTEINRNILSNEVEANILNQFANNTQLTDLSGPKKQIFKYGNTPPAGKRISIDQFNSDSSSLFIRQMSKKTILKQKSNDFGKEITNRRIKKALENYRNLQNQKLNQQELEIVLKYVTLANNNIGQQKMSILNIVSEMQANPLIQSSSQQQGNGQIKDLVQNQQQSQSIIPYKNDIRRNPIYLDQTSLRQRQFMQSEIEKQYHRIKSKKDQLSEIDLDKIQNFKIYFPKYNIENVIQAMQKVDINYNLKKFLINQQKMIQPQRYF